MRVFALLFAFVSGCSVLLGAMPAFAATTYVYDELGRLSKVCYDNGNRIVYNYDPAGNRTTIVVQGGTCN